MIRSSTIINIVGTTIWKLHQKGIRCTIQVARLEREGRTGMDELEHILKSERKNLVDEVETEGSTFSPNKLIDEIKMRFPMSHQGIDKTHVIWARVLKDLVWLGWLSEAKRRRGIYNDRICNALKESVSQAFITGQEYTKERP